MALSRYEEIFMRLVAAEVSAAGDPLESEGAKMAAESIRYFSKAAAKIEAHFVAHEREQAQKAVDYFANRGEVSALLKRQAE
jgi:hypothetical protein